MYFLWLYGSFKPLFTNIWLYALMSLARVGQSMMFWTSTNCNTCQHFFEKILNLCRLFCHRLLLSNIGYYICFKKQLCHTVSFFHLSYFIFVSTIIKCTNSKSVFKRHPLSTCFSIFAILFYLLNHIAQTSRHIQIYT